MNEKVGQWADAEMKHAIDHWRRQFRGDARVKDDKDVTDADIASTTSFSGATRAATRVLTKIADKLPIHWDKDGIRVGDEDLRRLASCRRS